MKQVRFGILSAGHIAGVMADTLSHMKGELVPYAIAARDGARAAAMAEQYGFEKSYGSYEELVQDENVDIVYVASPHSHHYQHVKLCLSHGKNVLCEKAFTANAAQAKELVALAGEKGLFLGEAVWTRFMPFVEKVRGLLAQGVIGAVQSVQCGFGQALTQVPRMTDPALAGGALLDLGIYPLTFASLFLGTGVQQVISAAVLTDRGVDAQNSITLEYAAGQLATLCSCMTGRMPNTGAIGGVKGTILCKDFWMCQEFEVAVDGEAPYTVKCPFEISGYEYEVRAAIKAMAEGRLYCDEMPWAESVRLMELMDGLREKWGVKFPFEA